MRDRSCIWHCGGQTRNISGICDSCWANREEIYRARKVREATGGKKPRTDKQQAQINRLNLAKKSAGTSVK